MYDCSEIHKLLHPALDRELDIKESLRVQSHLKDCPPCREQLLDEQEFLTLLAS
jgi:predicted anti-sigma-YlaC factor YlaD